MKKADIILLIFILFLSGFLLFFKNTNDSKEDLYLVVTVDSKIVKKDLYKNMINKEINLDNKYGHNKIFIDKNGVKVVEADCKDQVCVNTKEINKAGQTIICLPHRLEVKLISEKNGIDVIVK